MRLARGWRHILRYAWSVRLLVLSTVASSVVIALSVTGAEWLHWHPAAVLAVIVLCNVAAIIARIVDQKDWPDDVD